MRPMARAARVQRRAGLPGVVRTGADRATTTLHDKKVRTHATPAAPRADDHQPSNLASSSSGTGPKVFLPKSRVVVLRAVVRGCLGVARQRVVPTSISGVRASRLAAPATSATTARAAQHRGAPHFFMGLPVLAAAQVSVRERAVVIV